MPRMALGARGLCAALLGVLCVALAGNLFLAPVGAPVRLGVDVLLSERIELVEGARVGLVTHPAGVDGE